MEVKKKATEQEKERELMQVHQNVNIWHNVISKSLFRNHTTFIMSSATTQAKKAQNRLSSL